MSSGARSSSWRSSGRSWEKPRPDQRYASVPRPGVDYASEVFGFVKAHQAEYRIATMCRVLEVSRSGYYAWLAVQVLERGFTAATQFYAFPEAHWPRLRTTNGLERLHGEVKRRIKAAGAFPDRASALRLVTAVALRVTAIWGDRRYLDLSLLETQEVAQAA